MSIPFKFNPLGISGKFRKPLRLTATQNSSSVTLTKTGSPNVSGLKYRLSSSDPWSTYTIDTVIDLDKDEYVEFFNSNSLLSNSSSNYVQFVMTGQISASGNIQSLVNYIDNAPVGCFMLLFYNCSSLTSAPALPATTLANYCYNSMFYGCTRLIEAPELPAMVLGGNCYEAMFLGCSSLTVAPSLPAITLTTGCYRIMFQNCTSLVSAPEISATTAASYSCQAMFQGCTKLANVQATLHLTTLAAYSCAGMFFRCIALRSAPSLPALTLTTNCYYSMFEACTGLIVGPTIAATTLASNAMVNMFSGCSLLQSIIVKFSDWGDINATTNWMYNVAQIGTFTKPGGLPEVRGASNIPSGWTIANSYKRNLAYLESTGTQYIDTGVKPDFANGDEIEISYSLSGLTGAPALFGSRSNQITNCVYLVGAVMVIGDNEGYVTVSQQTIGDRVFKINDEYIINNGVSTTMPKRVTSTYSHFIFALNQDGRALSLIENMKLYEWKYYKNGVLTQHLIPVMNNDDVPCLYDKVTATFKYNAGTGQFNYGELPYKFKLNYLEGTGTQYIDAGVTNEDATIEITSYGVHSSGCRIGYANNEYRMTISSNRADSTFGSSINQYDQTNIGSYKHVFKLANDGGFYIDNELKYQHQSSISNYLNIYAFAFNNNGTATFAGNYTSRIYDVKISKNGVLTNHYIPVIDSNGVPAMYDEVNGTFKYNAGTGNFNYL